MIAVRKRTGESKSVGCNWPYVGRTETRITIGRTKLSSAEMGRGVDVPVGNEFNAVSGNFMARDRLTARELLGNAIVAGRCAGAASDYNRIGTDANGTRRHEERNIWRKGWAGLRSMTWNVVHGIARPIL